MAARHCISYSLWWLPSLTSLSFLVNYRASTASIRSSFISIEQVPLSLATKCHNRFILSYSVLIACGALCFTSFPCHTHSNAHRVTPPQKKKLSRTRAEWGIHEISLPPNSELGSPKVIGCQWFGKILVHSIIRKIELCLELLAWLATGDTQWRTIFQDSGQPSHTPPKLRKNRPFPAPGLKPVV